MGTYQGDPLGGTLFSLTHFRALHSIVSHSYLFPSIVNDIHIIDPSLIISSAYEHFQTKLRAICFSIQLLKCVTWSSSNLSPTFDTLS